MAQRVRAILDEIPDEFIKLDEVNAWTDMGPSARIIELLTKIVATFDVIEKDAIQANWRPRGAVIVLRIQVVTFLDYV